jgi:predicted phage-related endonuclease
VSLFPIPPTPEAWHALRARHVGASEVSILFDAAPDYMPGLFSLWHIKAGKAPPPQVDNPRTRWGLLLEDAIAAGAADREGWDVRPGQYASLDGLGATLDRIIASPGPNDMGREGPGVLELKNADWLQHARIWGDEPPIHILLQLQAQLAATGYSWGAVAVLVGGNDLRIYRYSARPKVQADILRRVGAFWASIREGRVPQPDGNDDTFRVLRVLEPEVLDEAADLTSDNAAPILCAKYLTAAAEAKAAEERRKEAAAGLLAKLGGHRWAKVPGFKLSQAVTEAKPDSVITADMVGQVIKGRAESRRITVKEMAA